MIKKMEDIETSQLETLFVLYKTNVTLYRIFYMWDIQELPREHERIYFEMIKSNPLTKIREKVQLGKQFDQAREEVRKNSFKIPFNNLKKYHFYLLKRIQEIEGDDFEFIEPYLLKYNSDTSSDGSTPHSSRSTRLKGQRASFIERSLNFINMWKNFKIALGKEIDFEIDETIKFERLLNPSDRDKRINRKLEWKGQKNQLYNVLRQLKNTHELIGNSYNSLADFLIENVTGFENTSKETIEKELKKNTPLPKNKRINFEPDKED